MLDLEPNTDYYIRSYAINGNGVNYSNEELVIKTSINPFYLADNGITIMAIETAEIGDISKINNISYTLVDQATLQSMAINNQDVSKVVTSRVTDLSHLFHDHTDFNQDISSWDVSNVTKMNGLFQNALFFNQNIGFWDVSNVVEMNNIFNYAIDFNQDISSWNVSNVTLMEGVFFGSQFNQDISSWNVAKVTIMKNMFKNASRFNQDLSSWSVSLVSNHQDFDLSANSWVLNRPSFVD